MSESKLSPHIKNCLSKGFNIVKIIGNICAFALLCLLCVLLVYTILEGIINYDEDFDIGKATIVSKWVILPLYGLLALITCGMLVKTASRLLKPWKLVWHIFYWLLPFAVLLLMIWFMGISLKLSTALSLS